jgi:dTDP-4-dehydrorhamnose 3,5-epimerase
MPVAERIAGTAFADARGEMCFFNTFSLAEVVRFYRIKPADTRQVRAWQAHRKEQKWFYCLQGSFIVNVISVPELGATLAGEVREVHTLQAGTPEILKIPGGCATGFRALESGSELMVFSDCTLEASKADDYRYPPEHWEFMEKQVRL